MKYSVTVDVPFVVEVEAEDAEAAERVADSLVAEAYEKCEAALKGDRVALGNRYDDTSVEQV